MTMGTPLTVLLARMVRYAGCRASVVLKVAAKGYIRCSINHNCKL